MKKIFIVSVLFVFLLNTFVYADFDNVLKEKYIVEYKYGDYISRTEGLIPILRILGTEQNQEGVLLIVEYGIKAPSPQQPPGRLAAQTKR